MWLVVVLPQVWVWVVGVVDVVGGCGVGGGVATGVGVGVASNR